MQCHGVALNLNLKLGNILTIPKTETDMCTYNESFFLGVLLMRGN